MLLLLLFHQNNQKSEDLTTVATIIPANGVASGTEIKPKEDDRRRTSLAAAAEIESAAESLYMNDDLNKQEQMESSLPPNSTKTNAETPVQSNPEESKDLASILAEAHTHDLPEVRQIAAAADVTPPGLVVQSIPELSSPLQSLTDNGGVGSAPTNENQKERTAHCSSQSSEEDGVGSSVSEPSRGEESRSMNPIDSSEVEECREGIAPVSEESMSASSTAVLAATHADHTNAMMPPGVELDTPDTAVGTTPQDSYQLTRCAAQPVNPPVAIDVGLNLKQRAAGSPTHSLTSTDLVSLPPAETLINAHSGNIVEVQQQERSNQARSAAPDRKANETSSQSSLQSTVLHDSTLASSKEGPENSSSPEAASITNTNDLPQAAAASAMVEAIRPDHGTQTAEQPSQAINGTSSLQFIGTEEALPLQGKASTKSAINTVDAVPESIQADVKSSDLLGTSNEMAAVKPNNPLLTNELLYTKRGSFSAVGDDDVAAMLMSIVHTCAVPVRPVASLFPTPELPRPTQTFQTPSTLR